MLLDNLFVEGNSTPDRRKSTPQGNTYQLRALADGSRFRVLKNFPTKDGAARPAPGHGPLPALQYYWLAEYQEYEAHRARLGQPRQAARDRARCSRRSRSRWCRSRELGIAEADEPHATFLENALAKARHASRAAGLPALADDSGLCVEALGGEPGVHSAYYAGREGSREERDARNNEKLLASLKDDRSAHYACVMVLREHPEDPRPLVAEGLWHGEIARAPRGANGFGYDPLFFLQDLQKDRGRARPGAEKPHQPPGDRAARSC